MTEQVPTHIPDEALRLAFEANDAHTQWQTAGRLMDSLRQTDDLELPGLIVMPEAFAEIERRQTAAWARYYNLNTQNPLTYEADEGNSPPQAAWRPPASLHLTGEGLQSMSHADYDAFVRAMGSRRISVQNLGNSDAEFFEAYGTRVPLATIEDFRSFAEPSYDFYLGARTANSLLREAKPIAVRTITDYVALYSGLPRQGLIKARVQDASGDSKEHLDMVALREALRTNEVAFYDIRNVGIKVVELAIEMVNATFPDLDRLTQTKR